MISKELLQILRCPDNRTPLALADSTLVERCNHLIDQRRLKNKAGLPVEHTLDGGLIRADRAVLYPIVDEIPVLLVDEAIPLNQLEQA
ncbi:MAG: Trm112 family protein [Planctomycetes bacterium]|nr:Trm112 family protein [Planctomycetota bacterium]